MLLDSACCSIMTRVLNRTFLLDSPESANIALCCYFYALEFMQHLKALGVPYINDLNDVPFLFGNG